MAAPFVAGVIALIISKHRSARKNQTPVDTPAQIREHILRTATDRGEIAKDRFYGYGVINPDKLF